MKFWVISGLKINFYHFSPFLAFFEPFSASFQNFNKTSFPTSQRLRPLAPRGHARPNRIPSEPTNQHFRRSNLGIIQQHGRLSDLLRNFHPTSRNQLSPHILRELCDFVLGNHGGQRWGKHDFESAALSDVQERGQHAGAEVRVFGGVDRRFTGE